MNYIQKYNKYTNKLYNIQIAGSLESYKDTLDTIPQEVKDFIFEYYKNINFEFLADKMVRELNYGNAGGPQVRSRYDKSISSEELAKKSINGLRILLAIKTLENTYPFSERTKITDETMLTDLAWHSFMLKPHKYYVVTNTLMAHINEYIKTNKPLPNLENLIKQVNTKLEEKTKIGREILLRDSEGTADENIEVNSPILVRHGTATEVPIELDIKTIVNLLPSKYGAEKNSLEWNMPMPLFPSKHYPYE